MTPEALAALHARCFDRTPPPWAAQSFNGVLEHPATVAVFLPGGFAIGRTAADEAELLTLAVAPDARRRGLGRRLATAFERAARDRGAGAAFLEVAASNAPARALYAALGYAEVGLRSGYYAPPGAAPVDALVLRKALLDLNEKA